jgi:hypothetical protein
MWQRIDSASHHLRWLLPKRLRRWICDRYDLSLGMTRDELADAAETHMTEREFDRAFAKGEPVDFYEDDEPAESIVAAFGSSRQRGTTTARNSVYRTYACPHMTISGPLVGDPPKSVCGCVMQQV